MMKKGKLLIEEPLLNAMADYITVDNKVVRNAALDLQTMLVQDNIQQTNLSKSIAHKMALDNPQQYQMSIKSVDPDFINMTHKMLMQKIINVLVWNQIPIPGYFDGTNITFKSDGNNLV